MNPDQTAPSGSILLAIYATKVHKQTREQTKIVEGSFFWSIRARSETPISQVISGLAHITTLQTGHKFVFNRIETCSGLAMVKVIL